MWQCRGVRLLAPHIVSLLVQIQRQHCPGNLQNGALFIDQKTKVLFHFGTAREQCVHRVEPELVRGFLICYAGFTLGPQTIKIENCLTRIQTLQVTSVNFVSGKMLR